MTTLYIALPVSGPDAALANLAHASLRAQRHPDGPALTVLRLTGRRPHGAKLDWAAELVAGLATPEDIFVTLDSDCVVWPGWAEWCTVTLEDPLISACGAPRIDGAPGLHPSLLACRAGLLRGLPSFAPTATADTGVGVSQWLETQGYLRGAVTAMTPEGWWTYRDDPTSRPLWWHLGSGTASAWPGLFRWGYRGLRAALGSVPHREAFGRWRRRRAFLQAAWPRVGR